ncbi:MAG: hypothetical protein A2V66_12580 [Ignavibacteria bacterium RBG_13_36_8]|nr:MAG: hypothetical protein A2V66_12580 [Ignavibacteria bacterium RBG_13_36_8]
MPEKFDWLMLEKRFNDLETKMKGARVDVQHGSVPEEWRVAGCPNETLQEFYCLSNIAGNKLLQVLEKRKEQFKEICNEPDPVKRWFKGIWHIGKNYDIDYIGEQLDADGQSMGSIFMGRIDNIAKSSALFCLELESLFPEREEIANRTEANKTSSKLWSDYAKPIIIGILVGIITALILSII